MSKQNTSIEHKVGLRVRTLRMARKMTQAELGRRAGGIAAAEVSKFENARRSPSLDSLHRIAEALGVELHELLDLTPPRDASDEALRQLNDRLRGVPGPQIRRVLSVVDAMLQD